MNMTFTRKRRLAVYAFAGSLGAALAMFGVIKLEWIPVLLGVVWAGSNLLAVMNVTPDDDPTEEEIGGEVGMP
jgi:hypothetical protein